MAGYAMYGCALPSVVHHEHQGWTFTGIIPVNGLFLIIFGVVWYGQKVVWYLKFLILFDSSFDFMPCTLCGAQLGGGVECSPCCHPQGLELLN